MKTGILFDLDGTLLDTLEDLADATNYALGRFGLPERTVAQVRQFVGNGVANLVRQALPGREDDPPVDQVLAVFREYYNAHCQVKTRPYPGIREALEELGEKYPLAVVSNKPDSAVKLLCGGLFPGLYARGESADCPRKPAPDMVYKTMAALGVERCVYVGDSDVDVATARNAGVPCLSVLWGFRDREVMEAAGSKYFCGDPTRLPEAIEKIMGEVYGQ